MTPPPLSLYVHLPWCVRKCPYCDFNSWAVDGEAPRGRYLDALLADLDGEAGRAPGRPLVSVYIGGGTPSLFTAAEIGRLLGAIGARFALAPDIEVTMEANPGTLESGDPGDYLAAGVNRLSIGAQSFAAASLAALGRIHSPADTVRSVAAARSAGIDNLNLDLMYALPGQGVDEALADLDAALALAPEHLSWYQLTLEPNTVFYARPPAGLPGDDVVADIERAGHERLEAAGLERYEISAYARPGRRSAHNLNYWSFGDYLAVGAGAHGKLTAGDEIRRTVKAANPRRYMERLAAGDDPGETVAVAAEERLFEFMLNALRLPDGFSESLFTARTGLPGTRLRQSLAGPIERGLIEPAGADSWRPTALGAQFLNDLQAEFLPA